MKRVAVLYGGLSEEREVSLRTGRAVCKALEAKGYYVKPIDVDRQVAQKLMEESVDLAFIALHGRYGEDGTIQGLLEIMAIPYTGSGVMASAVAMNKITTKRLLLDAKLPTPKFQVLKAYEVDKLSLAATVLDLKSMVTLPAVVKAATQGSTIGIYFVHHWEEMTPALEKAFGFDSEVLVEEFIAGMEVTASVLGNNQPQALPLIEITSVTGKYDYEAKYTAGMSEHIIPPRLTPEKQQEIQALALQAYQTLSCRGLSRVDFMITKDGQPYILEVNTSPGMTETSLFPDAARAAGIEFPELVDRLVKLALEEY
ncbi:MAG: D-alanine--D-alanine ligase [Carboxydocellales bacterium]